MKNVKTTYKIQAFQDDSWVSKITYETSSLEQAEANMQFLAEKHAPMIFRIVKNERVETEEVVDWTCKKSS